MSEEQNQNPPDSLKKTSEQLGVIQERVMPSRYLRNSFVNRRPGIEPADLKKMLQEVMEQQTSINPKFDPKQHKDKTRSAIALIFTWGYFGIILIGLVGVPVYNFLIIYFLPQGQLPTLDLKDVILTIGGILGSTFGFVLGYYFKGIEEN